MTQRDFAGVRAWYKNNEVWPGSIGFDPDGMCQKICRTAPNIGPGFASAFAQMVGTPKADRVFRIRDVVPGMIGLFDDPNDDNPFGHVVTWTGRMPGADPDMLASLLCRTNSVKSNQIVVVRGDYFGRHWGDSFQFASKSINGVQLDLIGDDPKKPKPPPLLSERGLKRLHHVVDVYSSMIENNRGNDRVVKALRRDRAEVLRTIKNKGRK